MQKKKPIMRLKKNELLRLFLPCEGDECEEDDDELLI